ncbi:MAG TPA: SMC-Scp complex subunit ScpB [Myxococcaceae bacterium]|nr:SMC-Scp complex subunit ScpB [Myxococcaceae bacterium]
MSTGEGPDDPGSGEPDLDDAPADIDEAPAELEPFDGLVQRSRRLPEARVRGVLEALLLVADRPVDLEQLHLATGIERPRLAAAMADLTRRLAETPDGGVVLAEVAGGWQLRTDAAVGEYVRRFLQVRPQRLTRAAVETLAIIAYRQPVTRPEIEEIRSVDSAGVLKALLDRRLIKILGKKEEIGRPLLYGTTREFLEFFALKDLSALPTLHEFQELSAEHQEILERDAPRPVTVRDLSDPEFSRKLEQATPSAEAALAELEGAIAFADEKARAAAAALGNTPPAPSPPGPDGDG